MCMDVGKWPSGTALAASRSEEWPTFILQYICSLFSHHYLFSARRVSRPELTTYVPCSYDLSYTGCKRYERVFNMYS